MKTEAKVIYRVSSSMNDDVELFDLKNDVDEYIDNELRFQNIHEVADPYTDDDFSVREFYGHIFKGFELSKMTDGYVELFNIKTDRVLNIKFQTEEFAKEYINHLK
ncbi:hypothetical protein N8508_00180 [bacterium]|nr:hypothetical protein [bacterium]